jgi:hypothetical protein
MVDLIVFATLAVILILTVILLYSFIFYRYIFCKYKLESHNPPLSELLDMMSTIIKTKLDLYDQDVFINKPITKTSEFDNYYRQIAFEIVSSFSDNFYAKISVYMKKDAVVLMMSGIVMNYLTERIYTNENGVRVTDI